MMIEKIKALIKRYNLSKVIINTECSDKYASLYKSAVNRHAKSNQCFRDYCLAKAHQINAELDYLQ